MAGICKQYPDLEFELVANPRSFSLTKREADLAVSMGPPLDGRVPAKKLTDYSLGLYASTDYLAEHAPIRSRKDLDHHRWVGYIDDLMWTSELNYFGSIPGKVSRPLHISSVITQMTAIQGHAGIGVLPNFMARHEPDLTRVLPDSIQFVRSYWLLTHADTRDLARVKLASTFLQDAVNEAGADYWTAQ